MKVRQNRVTRRMLIYGAAELAEVCHYYFDRDSDYEVIGFLVDDEYLKESKFAGLTVFPWSKAIELFPPKDFDCFVALGYSKVNLARKEVYEKVKKLGYSCPSYISSKAVVLNELAIGENCLILEHNTIQPFVKIGSNTTIWSGNHLGHHSVIGSHVFITSHVVISGGVSIGDQSFIGVNATIRDHISIGEGCIIGAGSVIMKSTDPYSVYVQEYTRPREISSDQIKKI